MIRFVTFNIRCDFEQDGINCFRFRKEGILKKLEEESPDIICFQEVLPHVAVWLKETLTDYCAVGCGRSEGLEDEQETVAFKKDRFNLVSMETFWLSPAPHRPGSRYEEQSICPRVTTETVLQDLREGGLLRVVNTHLDHEGSRARELGLSQIMEKITHPEGFPEAAVILAGDFNAEPDMPEMKVMERYPLFTDAASPAGATFHDYGQAGREEKIDYIYIQKPLWAGRAARWEECRDGVYLSDHYPVCVEIYNA